MAEHCDSFLFYWIYMLRNSVIHLCDRTGSKNENCGDCTRHIYEHGKRKEIKDNRKADSWVTNRKLPFIKASNKSR